MGKRLMTMGIVAGVLGLVLSGCAAADAGPVTEPAAATPTATTSSSADPAAAACTALSEPTSLSYNAWNDLQKGTIDVPASIEQLAQADGLFRAVDAPAGGIRIALSNVVAYIDAAVPGPDGQPYDTGTDEFFNLTAGLASACSAAGEELIVRAHGG